MFATRLPWLAIGKALLLSALVLIAYVPAMRAGFNWDDGDFLTQNKMIKAPDGLYRFWFTAEAPDYFPLTSSMLWIEWRLWEMNPMGYHVVNVLLHLGMCLALWRVLKRLKIVGAWLIALVYAVHPVNVESVAWITERKNTLPMFFAMLSVFLFLRVLTDERAFLKKDYLLSLLVFVLALLSKTSVALFPVVLLGCVWWIKRRITRDDIVRTLPFFTVAFVLSVVTIWFQYNRAIGDDIIRTDGFASRLAGAGWAVWFYLYKALLPVNLIFVYPRWEINAHNPISYVPGMLLIVLGYVFWRQREGWGRPFVLAMGYYVVTLFPVLGFFNIYFMKYSLVADHWQYTSLVGVVALVVGGAIVLVQKRTSAYRQIAAACAVALVLCLTSLTWRHSHIFTNEETLWRDTIAKNPRAVIAYDNLGVQLMHQGHLEKAIPLHQKALEIDPNNVKAMNNLGVALVRSGRFDEAEPYFQRALQLDPDFASVYNNIGLSLARQGDDDSALPYYQKALELEPTHSDALNNIANVYARRGDHDRAIEHFQKALEIHPDHAESHYGTALSLTFKGELDLAEQHYLRSLAVKPFSADTHNNLGALYQQKGDIERAISSFQQALRCDPSFSSARFNLANALALSGRFRDAIPQYESALQTEPQNAEIHSRYGDALAQIGRIGNAVGLYREALRLAPEWAMLEAKLAMMLATSADPSVRNIAEAIRLAENAHRREGDENAVIMDTLGIVYAEAGRFPEAISCAEKALSLVQAHGDSYMAEDITERLTYYREGRTVRFAQE